MITPIRHTNFLPGTLKNLFYPPERNEFTYFERVGHCAFANASTVVKAAWSADASMLAYARYGASGMDDADLDANFGWAALRYQKIGGTAGNWNASGTQARFASCAQELCDGFLAKPIDLAKLLSMMQCLSIGQVAPQSAITATAPLHPSPSNL